MISLRPARADELTDLSALCMRSKAVWGYAPEFLKTCEAELTIRDEDLANSRIVVAEEAGKVVGVVQIATENDASDLMKLFVEPACMRRGIGALLFAWACQAAKECGADKLVVESDPEAAAFYRKMGAAEAGSVPSGSIPARRLPKLEYALR